MTHVHAWSRTDDVMTDAGGGLCIQLVEQDHELFLDADVCSCGAVELVLHDDAAALHEHFVERASCGRCGIAALDVGHGVVSQGGAEVHAPLDRRWTFGLVARVCARGHVTFAHVGGSRVDGAPSNAELLVQHPAVGTCTCGGTRHEVAIESHHSGAVSVGDHPLCAQICARCESVLLARQASS